MSTVGTVAPAAPLDFEALLTRNYRPARVTHLVPQEADSSSAKKQAAEEEYLRHAAASQKQEKKLSNHSNGDEQEEKVLQLALKLVSQTPSYTRHIMSMNPFHVFPDESKSNHDSGPKPLVDEWRTLPPSLHEVELGDWENDIQWRGAVEKKEEEDTGATTQIQLSTNSPSDASSLLAQRRNPYLEALVLDKSNISWKGTSDDALQKARNVDLILDLGIAARSVARQSLPSSRPTPFGQTATYLDRMEQEWASPTSTANVGGSLHADKDEMEKIIKARQNKRAKMAIDKTNRVLEAMGTLAMGGGKGRTITSSLMGPGGTERTGRPSRQVGTSCTHESEYIDQLELVFNHILVKPDLRRMELRQYHRPRLPRNVIKTDMHWQFQVRIPTSSTKKTDSNTTGSSYQSMMMGSHAGSVSQTRIRNEADLSPSEGNLVLIEYCEERPPVQLTKGMASKIVNYYRGDKSRCPVSAGGGDRPTRRKQHGEKANQADDNNMTGRKSSSGKVERPPRLVGPDQNLKATITDWIGKPPKKSKEAEKEKSTVNVMPEGVTEILHPKVHGPFIGEIEEGIIQTGLISNLFAAPMFRHEAEPTDFLMILGKKPGGVETPGVKDSMGVVLRSMPTNTFTVGQTEPRAKVFAPNTTGERAFIAPFQCYQIAKALTRAEDKEDRGLRFDEINDGLFAYTKQLPNSLRQRIKQVAHYDKNTQIWTTKPIDFEDYPGVDALARRFSPEGVACYETASAAARRLCDLGIHDLFSGTSSIISVASAMVYLTGQVNALRDRKSKLNKMLNAARTARGSKATQLALYEKAMSTLEASWKDLRRKHEVARFIYEELQLAPWHLSTEFIDVHKNAQGSGMMKLTGLGDPSGVGEGFSFVRESDTKPNKSTGNTDGALSAQIKKITGTENDLRKLTMKQMASLLRSYGMGQKDIDTLKRWDRVHVIRDLSTKAASDGMGDGLERFARGEKMKLSEQKQMYQARIQEIWRRQRAALSTDSNDVRAVAHTVGGGTASLPDDADIPVNAASESNKQVEKEKEDSESDSDDDDLAALLEENMMDVKQTNQLVAAHMGGNEGGDLVSVLGGVGQQRRATTEEMSKDAREFAALQRQMEERRAAEAGLLAGPSGAKPPPAKLSMVGRKVIRRRVTKTYPDGRQVTSFKFILVPAEVDKIIRKKKEEAISSQEKKRKGKKHGPANYGGKYPIDRRIVGHSMFEEDDDVDHSRGRTYLKFQLEKTTRVIKKKGLGGRGIKLKHPPKLQLGKLKQKVSQEKRIKKRKREAEEADLYVSTSKRKGTSNRRERGSARERMPHVILADRLESIRNLVEKRPGSGPFHRPVSRRALPRYYEVISDPIDLQTIRDKNQRYEYKTTESFLREFDLMRNNATKFNGIGSIIGDEASNIFEFLTETVAQNRDELDAMEEAVREQMSGKKKKKSKASSKKKSPSMGTSTGDTGTSNVEIDGVAVNLGDLPTEFSQGGADSDSDDSFAAGLMGNLG